MKNFTETKETEPVYIVVDELFKFCEGLFFTYDSGYKKPGIIPGLRKDYND